MELHPNSPATLGAVLEAVARLSAYDEATIAEMVADGRIAELFPFKLAMAGEMPQDTEAEEDLIEASATPLNPQEREALIRSSFLAASEDAAFEFSEEAKETVVVIEEQPILREGLQRILEGEANLHVIGFASDRDKATAAEIIKFVGATSPKLVIAGLGQAGPQLVKKLREVSPSSNVLVFSSEATIEGATAALEAGASGYVSNFASAEELIGAVRIVLNGGIYGYSPDVAAVPLRLSAHEATLKSDKLRKRKSLIVRAISAMREGQYRTLGSFRRDSMLQQMGPHAIEDKIKQGFSDKEIARVLHVSLSTIRAYRKQIAMKTKPEQRVRAQFSKSRANKPPGENLIKPPK